MLKLAWKYMRYYKSQTFAIFASILLTASLLSGISSLIYSSQKSDLARKEKDIRWNSVEKWKSVTLWQKNL